MEYCRTGQKTFDSCVIIIIFTDSVPSYCCKPLVSYVSPLTHMHTHTHALTRTLVSTTTDPPPP